LGKLSDPGRSGKLLALTDALGNLVRFVLLPGQRFDTVGAEPLIEGVDFGALIGDKAFESLRVVRNWSPEAAENAYSRLERLDGEMFISNMAVQTGPSAIHLIALNTDDGHQWPS
jgi:hypothetical protein